MAKGLILAAMIGSGICTESHLYHHHALQSHYSTVVATKTRSTEISCGIDCNKLGADCTFFEYDSAKNCVLSKVNGTLTLDAVKDADLDVTTHGFLKDGQGIATPQPSSNSCRFF